MNIKQYLKMGNKVVDNSTFMHSLDMGASGLKNILWHFYLRKKSNRIKGSKKILFGSSVLKICQSPYNPELRFYFSKYRLLKDLSK